MSPRDQKAMQHIYAFYDLQAEILMALQAKARREVREKIARLMRLATLVRKSGGLRFLGGVDPVESSREIERLVVTPR